MGINRKAINFDLSTKSLEKYFKDTREPYSLIKKFMVLCIYGLYCNVYANSLASKPIVMHDLFLDTLRNVADVFLERKRKDGHFPDLGVQFLENKFQSYK